MGANTKGTFACPFCSHFSRTDNQRDKHIRRQHPQKKETEA